MGGGILKYIIMFAPLAIVFAMSFGQSRMSHRHDADACSGALRSLMGLSLSTIFLVYSGTSIASAFFATAAGFAALSLYGYTTKRDLSAFGHVPDHRRGRPDRREPDQPVPAVGRAGLVISVVGVLLFAGLTAYDTQRTKSLYCAGRRHRTWSARSSSCRR